jgi:ATP-dependent DNA helicase RecG
VNLENRFRLTISKLHGLSTKRLEALAAEGIHTQHDLLNFFPRRYLDRSNTQKMKHLAGSGEEITVAGKVTDINFAGYGRKKRLEVTISDGSADVKGVWFRGVGYFKKYFNEGDFVAFYGAAKRYGASINIAHPEVDKISSEADLDSFSRIFPIYPGSKALSKARITSKLVQSWMQEILKTLTPEEYLPLDILSEMKFPQRPEAYRMIHFPERHNEHKIALDRFKFEELFLFELSMEKINYTVKERAAGHRFTETGTYTATYFNTLLPFELTDGQKNCVGRN